MKRIAGLSIVCAAALLAGCMQRYDITLTNGVRITNVGKPVLHRDDGIYVYKDGTGQLRQVTAGRVVEIAPHSSKSTNFKPSSDRQ